MIVRQLGDREMAIDLEAITTNGRRFTVEASGQEYDTHGGRPGVGENRRTGKFVGGGALIGSIIGAIAGGGKGAAIGAGTGAGLGAGSEIITNGDQVKIPSETLLEFTLQQSVTIPKQGA